ncbi:MAG: hypothetical protein ACKVOQ_09340 [Cyclobacteriaceae bacterium]
MKKLLFIVTALVAMSFSQSCDPNPMDKVPMVKTFAISGETIGSDALSTDGKGNIYASNYIGTSNDPTNGNGTTVYKITPQGERSVFVDGLGGPAGSCFDNAGNFFVCTFNDGKVIKVSANGTKQVFAEGLEGPIQVVSDKTGNLFVSVAGIGNAPGTKIYKFTPSGVKSTLVDLASLGGFALSGVTIDAANNLYVANYVNGIIFKVTPQGLATLFADLGSLGASYTPITSYLTIFNNSIFATGLFANRIYKITLAGQASVLAGTGVAGSADGKLNEATFAGPNGIVTDPLKSVLYISESASKKVRLITELRKL